MRRRSKSQKIVPGDGTDDEPEGRVPTEEELALWKSAFAVFDVDGDGEVDINEVEGMFEKHKQKVDKTVLKEVFDSVDEDGSGAIDWEEFKTMMMNADEVKDIGGSISMMNHNKTMGSGLFKHVAKLEIYAQKKAKLAKYSTNSKENIQKREAEKKKEAEANPTAKENKVTHKAVLLGNDSKFGERSKLLWRTNTRLDIKLWVSNEEVLIVQTSSSSPTVIYPLVHLDYKAVYKLCEERNPDSDKNNKKKTDAEINQAQMNAVANYIVSRMQLEEAKPGLTSSQSAPATGAATTGKAPLVVAVNKLSADTQDFRRTLDEETYPVPDLNVVEALTSDQWNEQMQGIADDIKKASGAREKSDANRNAMGFSLDTLELLLNSVRFKKRGQLTKWARAINKQGVQVTMAKLEEIKKAQAERQKKAEEAKLADEEEEDASSAAE